jgi:hypothetical protein
VRLDPETHFVYGEDDDPALRIRTSPTRKVNAVPPGPNDATDESLFLNIAPGACRRTPIPTH